MILRGGAPYFAALVLFAAPPLGAESIPVGGWVTSSQGNPISGARVELVPVPTNYEVELGLLQRHLGPEAVDATVADATGRFGLVAPSPGVFGVVVRAPGFVPMRFPLLPLTQGVELPPVALGEAVPTPIEVSSADGRPLAEVAVYVEATSSEVRERWVRGGWHLESRIGWSDLEGRVALPRFPGELWTVHIFLPGSARSWRFDRVEEVHANLGPWVASDTTIEVRDALGEPVGGVVAALAEMAWPIGITTPTGHLRLAVAGDTEVELLTEHGQRQTITLDSDRGGTAEPEILVLPRSAEFTGRVAREDGGRGIAGALVWPSHDPGSSVTTDTLGRYRLLVGSSRGLRLQAESRGYLPRSLAVDGGSRESGPIPDLLLPQAASLHGRVLDKDGYPVAGARLEVAEEPSQQRQPQRPPAFRLDPSVGRAVSDSAGRFALGSLWHQGSHRITASHPGYTPTSLVANTGKLSGESELRITLRRGRVMFGRVLDLDEKFLDGASVKLFPSGEGAPFRADPQDPRQALSDAAGRFETEVEAIGSVAGERIDMVAVRAGFAPLVVRGVQIPAGSEPVDLGTLLLGPGAAVAGRVADPGGEGIPGAELWVLRDLERSEAATGLAIERPPDARTDEQGHFLLGDLAPGQPIDLLGDGAGYLPALTRGLRPPSDAVQVTLRRAARVSGEVVGEEGQPVSRARVEIWHREDLPPGQRSLETSVHFAATDEHGQFVFEDLVPGAWDISALAPAYRPSEVIELDLAGGQSIAGLHFELARGEVLEGQVQTLDGEPIEGATARLGRSSAVADTGGSFRVEGLSLGVQDLTIDHPGFDLLRLDIEIEAGLNTAEFRLRGGYPVTGRVVDEDHNPVGSAAVELYPEDARSSRRYQARTNTDGRFEWPRVATGTYAVRASKQGFVTTSIEPGVEVPGGPEPGADETLEVILRRGARLWGQILGLESDDLAAVRVVAIPQGMQNAAKIRGRVDFAGRYQLKDLGAGDWLVEARLAGGSRQTQARVVIDPEIGDQRRDLEFVPDLTLTGRALYADEPLAGANIALVGSDLAVEREVRTDPEGRFRIENLSPGRYRLGLTHALEAITHNEILDLESDHDLAIEISTAEIRGTVVSAADAEPVADALVSLQQLVGPGSGERTSFFTLPTDSAGTFRQSRLPPGRFHLRVKADGFEEEVRELDLLADLPGEDLAIELRPTAGLLLVARLTSGQVPRFVHLRVSDAADRVVVAETRVADELGTVHFASVPPGTWNLLVSTPESVTVSLSTTVPGEPLELTLAPAGRLMVRVDALLESDAVATLTISAPQGLPLHHLGMGGELQTSFRVEGGRVTVPGVPAGQWMLQIHTAEGRSWVSGPVLTTGGPEIQWIVQ